MREQKQGQDSLRTSLLAMVQTVKFDELDCRPPEALNSMRVECRPSNSMSWSADRQYDYWECRPSNCGAVAGAAAAADSDADRADLGLPDSISLFVMSSDSCVHHLHHRHHHHLHESVWFNGT